MATLVYLAVLLGNATPNASINDSDATPSPAVNQIGEHMAAQFQAVDRSFEQLAWQTPRDVPHWTARLPKLDINFPFPFMSEHGSHETAFLVRGQSPPYDPGPPGSVNPNLAQSMTIPPSDSTGSWIPQQPVWPGTPLLNPNGMQGGGPPQGSMMGVNGPRPFRFGWQSQADVGILPKESTNPGLGLGQFGVFEFNTELRYTAPTVMQHIFSIAPQFNLRGWDGPKTPPAAIGNGFTPQLGQAFRFGLDFRLTSPTQNGYTFELDFNPSIGTDFDRGLTSDALMLDGRGALFIRTSPQYLLVLGAMFLDRVDDQVLPYAGIVYTPNQHFEIRALFPQAEINCFIGAPWGVPQWMYLAGEYHIEAYQVSVNTPGLTQNQIQLQDWRTMLGVRSEHGSGMTSFLEAGWVFGRNVDFLRKATTEFDVSSGFIARFGLRY
ncbi:MAG: hypothetical protein O3C17_25060 [Planctomycetota bacterium]|nr:hypothetical protein [Planctomycetota bacterium]